MTIRSNTVAYVVSCRCGYWLTDDKADAEVIARDSDCSAHYDHVIAEVPVWKAANDPYVWIGNDTYEIGRFVTPLWEDNQYGQNRHSRVLGDAIASANQPDAYRGKRQVSV